MMPTRPATRDVDPIIDPDMLNEEKGPIRMNNPAIVPVNEDAPSTADNLLYDILGRLLICFPSLLTITSILGSTEIVNSKESERRVYGYRVVEPAELQGLI